MEVVSRGDGRWVEARPPRPSSPVPRAGLRIGEHGSIGALQLERQRIARSDDGRPPLGRAPPVGPKLQRKMNRRAGSFIVYLRLTMKQRRQKPGPTRRHDE